MKEGLKLDSGHFAELRFDKGKGFNLMYCNLCNRQFMGWDTICPNRTITVHLERTIRVPYPPKQTVKED